TYAILVIANIVHFFGSPYMMVISHFKLLNPKLEDICRSMGGNWFHIIKDVLIPNSLKVLLDVFVYFFTNSMITISAVAMLFTSSTMLLSVQITTFNDQGAWESALAVSLVIFAINACVKLWQNIGAARPRR
ncbi:MAG: ABC transporter permease subunit, partial [Clostridiales bacterium]|nr:ABC transporter permease subunit [Clostridiales bacterium]